MENLSNNQRLESSEAKSILDKFRRISVLLNFVLLSAVAVLSSKIVADQVQQDKIKEKTEEISRTFGTFRGGMAKYFPQGIHTPEYIDVFGDGMEWKELEKGEVDVDGTLNNLEVEIKELDSMLLEK